TGDSDTLSRITIPIRINTADNKNGTRQPQFKKLSPVTAETAETTRVAKIAPAGPPALANDVANPRDRFGACSNAISAAPPHSPPTATPWIIRKVTKMIGAATPIVAVVGSSPISTVAI